MLPVVAPHIVVQCTVRSVRYSTIRWYQENIGPYSLARVDDDDDDDR
jgi:hypothetical protein